MNGDSPIPKMDTDTKTFIEENDYLGGGWNNGTDTLYLVMIADGNMGVRWGLFKAGEVPNYCRAHEVSSTDAAILADYTLVDGHLFEKSGETTKRLHAHYDDGEAVLADVT